MKKKRAERLILAAAVLVLCIWTIYCNITVGLTEYKIKDDNIPEAFDGFRIAQISDLHNAAFGDNNISIITKLEKASPDIIVITGDLVDARHTDIDTAASLTEQIAKIAPCYFVNGNHEAWLYSKYNKLISRLEDAGVNILKNQTVKINKDGESIQLAGIDDADFFEDIEDTKDAVSTAIDMTNLGDGYKILLSHRPEMFDIYEQKGINLVFSGHAHGGQFRLPFIGGLIAPGQGLFPRYDGGVYRKNKTTMVVSRGIGNSIIPVRINNQPEIVLVILEK